MTVTGTPPISGLKGHSDHAWPTREAQWSAVAGCTSCGLDLLRLFVDSARWVVRRVETIDFLDERTVRRSVSVDYASPQEAVRLHTAGGDEVRVFPLAFMRRKSLINFDLRDEEGRAVNLLGLRENQALTVAIARAWTAASLADTAWAPDPAGAGLPAEVEELLGDVVSGDQTELHRAYRTLYRAAAERGAGGGGVLGQLGRDPLFRAVLDRLAESFLLFGFDHGPVGARRLVKFGYDEPLMLRYSEPGYLGHATPEGEPARGDAELSYRRGATLGAWRRAPLLAKLGLTPTLIRFPVPAAELAASFHFEITAPPEVSIVDAALLAGRPNLVLAPDDPEADRAAYDARAAGEHRRKQRRRPSFDAMGGGYPTVDLHVVDVPFGSLSRAQVALQAATSGWLFNAVVATWLGTATLVFAFLAHDPRPDVGATLLITFGAGMVALLAQPDPHRMVTRLLSVVRVLAFVGAALTVGGALLFAFGSGEHTRLGIGILAGLGLVPTLLVTLAWMTARKRLERTEPRESPWEQHRVEPDDDVHAPAQFHVALADRLEAADYPYDEAVVALGFAQPAVRVASSEGARSSFPYDAEFMAAFRARMERAPAGAQPAPTGDVRTP